jgi:hypothetical protein
MLHDLVDDPGQKRDLARELPKVHRALVQEYLEWEAGAVAAVPAPQAVHLGFAEWPRVEIGAHEFDLLPGAGRGIDYCSPGGYANQWITKWTDPAARAECRLRVVRAGRYRVMFRYAATPESVGSRFALAAGSARLEFEITEPWISAPRPAPEQGPRSSGGYLSREWKDVPVGEMDLAAGDHVLQVLALRAAGPSLPDVKAVIFEAL